MGSEGTVTIPLLERRVQLKALNRYWVLTKPEISFLIAITVFVGFCLAQSRVPQSFPLLRLLHTMFGTLLVASGSSTLNQFMERDFDARMRRTARRPLVAGGIDPHKALWFGILLSCGGGIYLAWAVNWLTSSLAVFTLASYLFLYTPLKRKTALCTLIGAFPGAAPPLIGWAAASGKLSLGAWILFGMLFLWQFPHFMAIAWMYREDYDRAGYLILPKGGGRRRRFVARCSLLPAFALIPLSLLPTLLGYAGYLYFTGALLLSFGFYDQAAQLVSDLSNTAARRLLLASIIYLPSVFLLLLLDKI